MPGIPDVVGLYIGDTPLLVPGVTYDPVPVTTNLHAHFDATQLALADGDAVAQWDDVSGNGRHATQGTPAAQPTFRKTAGGTWVAFDGVDDYLSTASWSDLAQPNDVFLVMQAPEEGIWFDGLDDSHEHRVYANAGQWAARAGLNLAGGTFDKGPHVILVSFNTTTTIRVDGTQVASGSAGGEGLNGAILGSFYGLSTFGKVNISEVLIYSAALGTTDRDAVEDHLAAKWGTP